MTDGRYRLDLRQSTGVILSPNREAIMSRYYLHLRHFNGRTVEDQEGTELPTLAAAKTQALLSMRELIGNAIEQGVEPAIEAILVADMRGTQLAAVPVIAALPRPVLDLLKRPEKVLSHEKIAEFRLLAEECRLKAEHTAEPDDKISWLKLAFAWLDMLPATELPPDLDRWPKPSESDSKASH